jgi:NAD(P)-dependent dehydrogenase (short-subunit alcohol dehydrogenase family)
MNAEPRAAAGGLRDFRLDGCVAAITGGAAGIGLATARLMAEAGARVAILDRDERAGADAAAQVSNATFFAMDASDESSVDSTFARLAAQEGRVDILVNNAGISIRKSSGEISLSEWNRVVGLNLTGSFLCARAAARHMPAEGGSVVNTASVMGLSGGGPYPNPAYHATKGALVNLTRSLAIEWAPRRIRVNAVAPTWTETGFIGNLTPEALAAARAATPLGRLARPQDVASAILFLASPAAAMVTGHVLAVDGGFLAQ